MAQTANLPPETSWAGGGDQTARQRRREIRSGTRELTGIELEIAGVTDVRHVAEPVPGWERITPFLAGALISALVILLALWAMLGG